MDPVLIYSEGRSVKPLWTTGQWIQGMKIYDKLNESSNTNLLYGAVASVQRGVAHFLPFTRPLVRSLVISRSWKTR